MSDLLRELERQRYEWRGRTYRTPQALLRAATRRGPWEGYGGNFSEGFMHLYGPGRSVEVRFRRTFEERDDGLRYSVVSDQPV